MGGGASQRTGKVVSRRNLSLLADIESENVHGGYIYIHFHSLWMDYSTSRLFPPAIIIYDTMMGDVRVRSLC